jgi:N-carbamoyl-L-amino-acid hydrolase
VQPYVDQVRRPLVDHRPLPRGVGQHDGDVGGAELAEEGRRLEGRVPHLDGVPQPPVLGHREPRPVLHALVVPGRQLRRGKGRARELLEEAGHPLRVVAELRRQLPQERAELVVEGEHPGGEEVRERRRDVAELLHVRDEARPLHREDEVLRRLRVPLPPRLGPLQGVERAVDLDRAQAARGELELAPLRQARGVEHAPPRRVAPPRDADPDLRHGPTVRQDRAVTEAGFDALWSALAPVGRDDRSGGYRRWAWTREDRTLREWFAAEAAARGLDLTLDRAGNQWAWWGDPDRDGPGVVTGSHLDSVPDGGAYDGPLGVVSALLAVDALRARGASPARPLGVVCFGDEEGARFGIACAGSRLVTGALDPERARALRDEDGTTMAEAMTAAAVVDPEQLGRDEEVLRRVGAFVELHVEQGRWLVDRDAAVGVATAIWPHGRWRVDLAGEANHAGTTRLADRRDPMLDLARLVLAARAQAEAHGALATVGRVRVTPNGTNAIPSSVQAWLDARGPVAGAVRDLVAAVGGDVGAEPLLESWTEETPFDAELRTRVAAVLGGAPTLPTGAGHDAGVLSEAGIPTAMLFVRNPTGVSHSPAEHAERADCLAGVEALADVLAELVS